MTTCHINTDRWLVFRPQTRAKPLDLTINKLHIVHIDRGQDNGAHEKVHANEQVDLIRIVIDPEMFLVKFLLKRGQYLRYGLIGGVRGEFEFGDVGRLFHVDVVIVAIEIDGQDKPAPNVQRHNRPIDQKLPRPYLRELFQSQRRVKMISIDPTREGEGGVMDTYERQNEGVEVSTIEKCKALVRKLLLPRLNGSHSRVGFSPSDLLSFQNIKRDR